MASISSTNSSSSLGNTSLRGFGGMASGIDRDAIIEKMTLGTTTKINNQKSKITQLEWKQEAYRSISDKIIDWSDTYASYASSSNLKDPSVFAKNQITVHGTDDSAKFVTATGTSELMSNVSIKGVEQLATSTVRQSEIKYSKEGLKTKLSSVNQSVNIPDLKDTKLTFGTWISDEKGFKTEATFTFNSTYTDKTGTHTIDYTTTDTTKLVGQLNDALAASGLKLGETEIQNAVKFKLADDGTIQLEKQSGFEGNYNVKGTAMTALGYTGTVGSKGVGIDEFNKGLGDDKKTFASSYMHSRSAVDYFKGKKVTFNYDGNQKSIELITSTEAQAIKDMKLESVYSADELAGKTDEEKKAMLEEAKMNKMMSNLQTRLDQAFGKGAVNVALASDNTMTFKTKEDSTVSVTSNDAEMLKNLGFQYGSSNKVNLDGKLSQGAIGINAPEGDLDLVINGVAIKGLTANSSINDILTKINSNTKAGVKATYVSATGQFMLVSNETGSGRQIVLGNKDGSNQDDKDSIAWKLFGGDGDGAATKDGQNAKIHISYGNGIDVALERSSNTFNLEGLNVTVSGTFGGNMVNEKVTAVKDAGGNITGYKNENGDIYTVDKDNASVLKDKNGNSYNMDGNGYLTSVDDGTQKMVWKADSSQTVTFSAKADVEGALEKVKKFIEDYNALVSEIDTQIKTRPDSNYAPLTDDQKAEMDETSIENWENKAKQGMLYGDAAMRDLSMDVQSVFTKMMTNGASYEDMKEIGITYSEDWGDGGTLVFDEAKFKEAMENNPDKVSNIFTGGGGVTKGLIATIEDTFTPYATRYANKNGNGGKGSYGRLIEIAGSEKKPTTVMDNEIYKQLKEMQETIDKLQDQLKIEQDRYISQFTTMESLLNQMNTQSSYLSQLTA